MNDENLLTLHCPKCKQITEVIAENGNLVCVECGWRFDDKTAARYLNPSAQPVESQPAKA